MNHMLAVCGLAAAIGLHSQAAAQSPDDWGAFRGAAGSSIGQSGPLPTSWSVADGTNVEWSVDLPGRGVSGPIVVGDKVFITSSDAPQRERLYVAAYDAGSGAPLWKRRFWATGRTVCHPTSENAAPTPASDGGRVFALFASADVVALDFEGNVVWFRGLALDHPGLGNDIGMASSPIVVGDAVICQLECQGNSCVVALDRKTGKTLWEKPRPKGSNWATPLAWNAPGAGAGVLLQGEDGLSLLDAATGDERWKRPGDCAGIASATLGESALFLPLDGLTAIARDRVAVADAAEPPLWKSSKLGPGSPSPIAWRDVVLTINRSGVLVAGDAATGEVRWRRRLGGQFWATPVVAETRLYAVNSDGVGYVVDLADEGKLVGEFPFGEEVLGSPAVSGAALFVRGRTKLWKVAAVRQAAAPSAGAK
ncbi:MAG: PQQ-binding-like beta-propeller repeat protein [Lacipirellulaceae bacterium]